RLVVGMDARQHLFRRLPDLGLFTADEALPARRVEDLVRAEVPVPQAVIRACRGQGIAPFALAQLALELGAFGRELQGPDEQLAAEVLLREEVARSRAQGADAELRVVERGEHD